MNKTIRLFQSALILGLATFSLSCAANEPAMEKDYRPFPVKASEVTTPKNDDVVRQTYRLDKDQVKINRAIASKVAKDSKNAGLVYFIADPMCENPYLPDSSVEGLKANAPLDVIAAKGEFEPASFLFYPLESSKGKLDIIAQDLKSATGDVLPASALDIKVIKCWYKSGSAWYGMFVDPLRRRLIPELLLNDEDLVYADAGTQENYLYMKGADGRRYYQWASASVHTLNWHFTEPDRFRIEDADTFQGVVLNKDELKQIMVTVHVPATAKAGLYQGNLKLAYRNGKSAGVIPVRVKVLPFELPYPMTNYNTNKQFIVGFYGFSTRGITEKRVKNIAEHNVRNVNHFPRLDLFFYENAEQDAEWAKKYDINTKILIDCGPSCGICTKPVPSRSEQSQLDELARKLKVAVALSKRLYGHTNFYCYGVDEGNADVLRAEQAAFKVVRNAGAKTMVSSYPRGEMMFNLDMINLPESPHPQFAYQMAKSMHEANPDSIVTFYSNPHCGGENPDFNRKYYGLMPYANNLDGDMNYAMINHNVKIWSEFGDMYESDRRNNSLVYVTKDDFIDTLEWEGVREGIDDIRYITLMRQLCAKALESKNPATKMLGRKGLSKLAYNDLMRRNPNALRLEAINFILRLQDALKGE